MQSLKDSILMKIMKDCCLIPKTANTTDLENKIKFISSSSPSIVFIENFKILLQINNNQS
jgi:ABC-2 type transport system permease protein